jgi:hypothetical protein
MGIRDVALCGHRVRTGLADAGSDEISPIYDSVGRVALYQMRLDHSKKSESLAILLQVGRFFAGLVA